MPTSLVNGVQLFWEQRGDRGDPVVFVHGSWGDHHNWDLVAPPLSEAFRVVAYDRRGHSASERPPGQGRLADDVADLAALIETLGLAPAHVVGNSGGAIVVLQLAAERPDLFASVAVHEPPMFALIHDHPMMPAVRQRIGAVGDLLRAGDMAGGARLFVESIAFGPGAWETLTPEMQRTFVFNAPTFLDELNEGERVMGVDLERLAAFTRPMLLTKGDQSAPFFPAIIDTITTALPRAKTHTFHGAGHVPHLTAPEAYDAVVGGFLKRSSAARV